MTRVWFTVCLALLTTPAAAINDPLAAGLRNCAVETDATKRLTCFDKLSATLPTVEADKFGLTADIQRRRDPAAERAADAAVLPGKIVAMRQAPQGELVFTLDNQQVWMQTQPEPGKHFVVGDAVHIEYGAMGSLWLAAGKARKTRVRRIS